MVLKYLESNKALSRALTLILLFGGLFSLNYLSRTNYPVVKWDILRVKTPYPNTSAKNVEIKVTNKIEKRLLEISGIEKIVSHSMDNLSLVMLHLDTKNPNQEAVKREIRSKLDSIYDLPSELPSAPIVEEIKTSDATILEVALTGPDIQIRNEMAKKLKDKLLNLEGILGVKSSSILEKEVMIEIDLRRLNQKKLSLQEVVRALKTHHLPSSGFQLKTNTGIKKIITNSRFEDIKDIERLILRSNASGKKIRLREVASISEKFKRPKFLTRTDGVDSHNLSISVSATSDNIRLSKKIRAEIDQFKRNLSKDIKIEVIKDLSLYTSDLLSILTTNTILGFLFVFLVLLFFLPPYVAFWTGMGIPLSFLGSFILFKFFSIPINTVTLVSLVLVLGLLVDDAIVIAENIAAKKEAGLKGIEAASEGVKEIFWPVTVTIITTILAFLPLYFLEGLNGQFIRHIPVVVSIALIISLFEATVLLPFHLVHGKGKTPKNIIYDKALALYKWTIENSLKNRVLTLLFFVVCLVGTGSFFKKNGSFVLFPRDDVDFFHVVAELPPGTTLESTIEKMKEVEKEVQKIPKSEMLHFTTQAGHHQTNVFRPLFATKENWGMISVILKPSEKRNITSEEIVEKLHKRLKKIRGFDKLDIEFHNDGPPVGKAFEISLIGRNEASRMAMTQEIVHFLKAKEGVFNISTTESAGKKQLSLSPGASRLASMQVEAKTLEETIALAFKEKEIGYFIKDGEERFIKLKLGINTKEEKKLIREIPIPNKRGVLIPLKKLAVMKESSSSETIQHTRGIRSTSIEADINQAVMTSLELNESFQELIPGFLKKYPDIEMSFEGENKSTKETLENLGSIFGIVLLLIFFSLIWSLKSMVLPLIILGILPFGAIGILWAFYFHNLPVSFLGLIGGIGLLGIMVNDGLILLSLLNDLPDKRLPHLVKASISRFRPIILTTLTTVLGMIPTIYGFGGTETFIVPIVLSVAGGIIFATLITLYMVPCLFSLYIDFPLKKSQSFKLSVIQKEEAYP